MERPSRATTLILNNGAGPLHPGDFWRSLSRHSLRDVSKPRRHSTQPHPIQGCKQGAGPFSTLKGDIQTAPPSRSRVLDHIHTTRNVVKRNFPLRQNSSWPCLTRPSLLDHRVKPGDDVSACRHGRVKHGHDVRGLRRNDDGAVLAAKPLHSLTCQ